MTKPKYDREQRFRWYHQVDKCHRPVKETCQIFGISRKTFYYNPQRVWQAPYEWLRYYNFECLHLSLKGLTPQEKVLQSVIIDC